MVTNGWSFRDLNLGVDESNLLQETLQEPTSYYSQEDLKESKTNPGMNAFERSRIKSEKVDGRAEGSARKKSSFRMTSKSIENYAKTLAKKWIKMGNIKIRPWKWERPLPERKRAWIPSHAWNQLAESRRAAKPLRARLRTVHGAPFANLVSPCVSPQCTDDGRSQYTQFRGKLNTWISQMLTKCSLRQYGYGFTNVDSSLLQRI